MQLTIVTPRGILKETATDAVHFPGTMGRFEVLRGHAPMISELVAGDIRYSVSGGEECVAIAGGFVRVENDCVEACVELKESR